MKLAPQRALTLGVLAFPLDDRPVRDRRSDARLEPPMVEDHDIIQLVKEKDDEFTAERIRFALQRLVSHGLVDEWQPASRDLIPVWPVYGRCHTPSLRLRRAQSAVTNAAVTARWTEARLPSELCGAQKPLSCLLRFTEEGYFVTDDIWADETCPAHSRRTFSALRPGRAACRPVRRDWVQQVLLESTRGNRGTAPGGRSGRPTPASPSRSPVARRGFAEPAFGRTGPDLSVPDDLSGTGPWQGWADDILDKLISTPREIPGTGVPLCSRGSALACRGSSPASSSAARRLGSRRLGDMVFIGPHGPRG